MGDEHSDPACETELPEGFDTRIRTLINAGQAEDAARACFQGLQQLGDRIGLLEPLAEIYYRQGDLTRAGNYLRRLCALEPDAAPRWLQLGTVLGAADRSREAVEALGKAYEIDPHLMAAGVNLGVTLVKLQRHEEAADILGHVCRDFPEEHTASLWLGHALNALDRLEPAAEAYENVAGDEKMAPLAWMPLGVVWRGLGDLERSNGWFRRVLEQEPDQPMARFALAQNQLMAGDFKDGFANYEYRWRRPNNARPEFASPLWRGEPVAGRTVLVHDEQGFGDCIQFCRFLRIVKDRGAIVAFRPRARLAALLKRLDGVDILVSEGEGAGEDFHVPLLSLPHLLEIDGTDIDGRAYLAPDPALQDHWRKRLDELAAGRVKVGLVWQGDPNSQSEQGRSVPFDQMAPLFKVEKAVFFLLQKQHGRQQLGAKPLPDNVIDLEAELDRGEDAFVDTAAVMTQLDKMVTSDTAPAHLAGALGVPTSLLLKKVPEWRWMLTGEKSPWYESLSLFRQKNRGEWKEPVTQVADGLRRMI